MGLFGIILVFCPSAGVGVMTILLGISFIRNGILNISALLALQNLLRENYPDYKSKKTQKINRKGITLWQNH